MTLGPKTQFCPFKECRAPLHEDEFKAHLDAVHPNRKKEKVQARLESAMDEDEDGREGRKEK